MQDGHASGGWAAVAQPLIGVVLGGMLAIIGGVLGAKFDRESEAAARREERMVAAYSATLSDLTKAAIHIGEWHGALGRADNAEIASVRLTLQDDQAALLASVGMVAVVGSEDAADLVVDAPTIVFDALSAPTQAEAKSQIRAISDVVVQFRTQVREEVR